MARDSSSGLVSFQMLPSVSWEQPCSANLCIMCESCFPFLDIVSSQMQEIVHVVTPVSVELNGFGEKSRVPQVVSRLSYNYSQVYPAQDWSS